MTDNLYILILLAMTGTAILVFFFILLQMRHQNRMHSGRRKMQEAEIQHQKELLESVITSQEAERKRIGMDLHDEIGAALSALRINIERKSAELSYPVFFSQCKTEIDQIIDNMRNIAHHLSPRISGSFGLHDAIHELADMINKTGKIKMQVLFDENKIPVFTNEQSPMALYRVLAELVNNTLKHASASQIILSVEIKDGKMELIYQDNGDGLQTTDMGKQGMGMRNIESRLSIIGAGWKLAQLQLQGYQMIINVPVDTRHFKQLQKPNPDDQHTHWTG
ncbi:histidine kinase [Terrimonas sp. NA20]|uniref:histidine kinase n=1 Tax=Terrimonas ginsenosidimutans TaxID=2908004 RepID=A0ABS9KV57_9BACT|nr:histidine kinase [Terrimonas ginsenosidimutans]MCG2616165.1 histidine kinase [Terrimonas ginsenosidimutans]